jgi:hypothetical protein
MMLKEKIERANLLFSYLIDIKLISDGVKNQSWQKKLETKPANIDSQRYAKIKTKTKTHNANKIPSTQKYKPTQ